MSVELKAPHKASELLSCGEGWRVGLWRSAGLGRSGVLELYACLEGLNGGEWGGTEESQLSVCFMHVYANPNGRRANFLEGQSAVSPVKSSVLLSPNPFRPVITLRTIS